MPVKVCMLSCLHGLMDDRIYWKESLSLARNGYEVIHIGAQENDCDFLSVEGIRLIGVKKTSRFSNPFVNKVWQFVFPRSSVYETIFTIAANLKADVYHFHDLQLNLIATRLKQLPHRPIVIYDVHEDYFEAFLDSMKRGFLLPLKKLGFRMLDRWEKNKAATCDAVVAATDYIQSRFLQKAKVLTTIYNYSYFLPVNDHLPGMPDRKKKYDLIYAGTMSPQRGTTALLQAIALLKQKKVRVNVLLIGWFSDSHFANTLLNLIDKENISDCIVLKKQVPFDQVKSYYEESAIGVALFAPSLYSQKFMPIKLFEYMSLGLPVLSTSIGLTAELVRKANCGLICDPLNTEMVAHGIQRLLEDKILYEDLRNNGLAAAGQYTWPAMELRLLDVYKQLLEGSRRPAAS